MSKQSNNSNNDHDSPSNSPREKFDSPITPSSLPPPSLSIPTSNNIFSSSNQQHQPQSQSLTPRSAQQQAQANPTKSAGSYVNRKGSAQPPPARKPSSSSSSQFSYNPRNKNNLPPSITTTTGTINTATTNSPTPNDLFASKRASAPSTSAPSSAPSSASSSPTNSRIQHKKHSHIMSISIPSIKNLVGLTRQPSEDSRSEKSPSIRSDRSLEKRSSTETLSLRSSLTSSDPSSSSSSSSGNSNDNRNYDSPKSKSRIAKPLNSLTHRLNSSGLFSKSRKRTTAESENEDSFFN